MKTLCRAKREESGRNMGRAESSSAFLKLGQGGRKVFSKFFEKSAPFFEKYGHFNVKFRKFFGFIFLEAVKLRPKRPLANRLPLNTASSLPLACYIIKTTSIRVELSRGGSSQLDACARTVSPFFPKRQRAGALQDASRRTTVTRHCDSVLECGGPPQLGQKIAVSSSQ
jgi:hypothetical protein